MSNEIKKGVNNNCPTILGSYAGFRRYFGAPGTGGMKLALYILTDRAIPDDPGNRRRKEDEDDKDDNVSARRGMDSELVGRAS